MSLRVFLRSALSLFFSSSFFLFSFWCACVFVFVREFFLTVVFPWELVSFGLLASFRLLCVLKFRALLYYFDTLCFWASLALFLGNLPFFS